MFEYMRALERESARTERERARERESERFMPSVCMHRETRFKASKDKVVLPFTASSFLNSDT